MAGALSEADYIKKLAKAGSGNIDVGVLRFCGSVVARTFLAAKGFDGNAVAKEIDSEFVRAFIRATKPTSRCAPDCRSQ